MTCPYGWTGRRDCPICASPTFSADWAETWRRTRWLILTLATILAVIVVFGLDDPGLPDCPTRASAQTETRCHP